MQIESHLLSVWRKRMAKVVSQSYRVLSFFFKRKALLYSQQHVFEEPSNPPKDEMGSSSRGRVHILNFKSSLPEAALFSIRTFSSQHSCHRVGVAKSRWYSRTNLSREMIDVCINSTTAAIPPNICFSKGQIFNSSWKRGSLETK